jgi:endonuclease-3
MSRNKPNEIIQKLKKYYDNPKTALNYKTPFELLVATIMSAQCTDERVNKITPNIFKKYTDVYGFAKAKQVELETEIKSCGFFRNKSQSIIETSKRIVEFYDGKVPNTMEDLLTLRGVARKTANIILSSCYKKAEGIAVDTHVARLANRFEFSSNKNPDKIEQDLLKIFEKKDWLIANYLLVEHGRNLCKAIKPKCETCFLNDICPFVNQDKNKKPFVTIKFAQSLDGKIATNSGDSKWISNEKALKFTHELRANNDAILVGINTVLTDNPTLNTRLVKGKSPIRIILDSSLKTPLNSTIVKTAKDIKTIIFTTTSNQTKIKTLSNKNIEIIQIKSKKIELKYVLKILSEKNIKTLLVEGGSKIISSFLKEKLVDKIYIIIAPILIGNDGIPAIQNLELKKIKNSLKLNILDLKKLDDNLVVEMRIET